MNRYLLLILCWLAFTAEAACSNDAREKNYPSRTVALQKKLPDAFYYYRIDHYAIVVEPATLIHWLEKQVTRDGALSDGRLLKDIRSDTPVNQHKDLFALVLKEPLYLARIELLLAEILQNGAASVVDAYELPGESQRFVAATVVRTIEERAYKGREFCTPAGDLLLKITDQID